MYFYAGEWWKFTPALTSYGYYLVYRKPKTACAEEAACARPLPNRLVKGSLWFATVLILIAFAWPVIIPVIAPYIFG